MDLKLHDIVELKKDHPCGRRRGGGGAPCVPDTAMSDLHGTSRHIPLPL